MQVISNYQIDGDQIYLHTAKGDRLSIIDENNVSQPWGKVTNNIPNINNLFVKIKSFSPRENQNIKIKIKVIQDI